MLKIFDCLRRIGFQGDENMMRLQTPTFFCDVVRDIGAPTHFLMWNVTNPCDRRTITMPRENRIWTAVETWEQFEAGFSFLLTQFQFDRYVQIRDLVPSQVRDVLVAGGCHAQEFEPVRRFAPQREVTDADFSELQAYVAREDSTTQGYFCLRSRIGQETWWSVGGFKLAREVSREQEREWMKRLREHDKRNAYKEFVAGMPYKFVLKKTLGRPEMEEIWEIDFAKKCARYAKPGCGILYQMKCGKTPKRITEETADKRSVTEIVSEMEWKSLEEVFQEGEFFLLGHYCKKRRNDFITGIDLEIKKGNHIVYRCDSLKGLDEKTATALCVLGNVCARHFVEFMDLEGCLRDVVER